jgi:hypothetical protein
MPRITVNINQKLNNKLLKLSKEKNESLSTIIKQFIELSFYQLENTKVDFNKEGVEVYCQQLSIQTNALLRKISMKLLDLTSEDLEIFKEISQKKYREILENKNL